MEDYLAGLLVALHLQLYYDNIGYSDQRTRLFNAHTWRHACVHPNIAHDQGSSERHVSQQSNWQE